MLVFRLLFIIIKSINLEKITKMKKALAIDGNSMFYRMYYATLKQLEYSILSNNTPNNAIRLMLSQLVKLIKSNEYEYYFVAFDKGCHTFRHNELESYKENRKKTPDELFHQMTDCITAINDLGITTMSDDDLEADDLIASFAQLMNNQGVFVDVFSSDKDLLQLVNTHCTVNLMKTGLSVLEVYTADNFQSKFFDLSPAQVIEYKSIVGDLSDRLKGVPGIGKKTGVDLLLQYGSLDNIYVNLHSLSSSQQKKFIEHKESAYQCKRLATLCKDKLLDRDPESFKQQSMNIAHLKEIILKYNLNDLNAYMNSLVKGI